MPTTLEIEEAKDWAKFLRDFFSKIYESQKMALELIEMQKEKIADLERKLEEEKRMFKNYLDNAPDGS